MILNYTLWNLVVYKQTKPDVGPVNDIGLPAPSIFGGLYVRIIFRCRHTVFFGNLSTATEIMVAVDTITWDKAAPGQKMISI